MSLILEREVDSVDTGVSEGGGSQSEITLNFRNIGLIMCRFDSKYDYLIDRVAHHYWLSLGCPRGRPNGESQDKESAACILMAFLREEELVYDAKDDRSIEIAAQRVIRKYSSGRVNFPQPKFKF